MITGGNGDGTDIGGTGQTDAEAVGDEHGRWDSHIGSAVRARIAVSGAQNIFLCTMERCAASTAVPGQRFHAGVAVLPP